MKVSRISCLLFRVGVLTASLSIIHAVPERITKLEEYRAGHKVTDPYKYQIANTPQNIDTTCKYIESFGVTQSFHAECVEIRRLNDNTGTIYTVSYLNAFFGAIIAFVGIFVWANNDNPWVFIGGITQHSSAYITNLFASKWSTEANKKMESVIQQYNEKVDAQGFGSGAISKAFQIGFSLRF